MTLDVWAADPPKRMTDSPKSVRPRARSGPPPGQDCSGRLLSNRIRITAIRECDAWPTSLQRYYTGDKKTV
jgi:hypothetical protein